MRKHKHPKKRGNPNHHINPLTADKVERLLYGETLPNIHTKERLEQARKGTLIMPSLQDALQIAMQKQQQDNAALHATINEWTQDDQPQTKPQPKEQAVNATQTTKTTQANYPINLVKHANNRVLFTPTVGVSEATFNYVKNNPGKSRMEIINALTAQGFKEASVSSLIGQFTRMDYFLRDANGKHHAAHADYKPLPSTKRQMKYKNAKQAVITKSKPAPKTITLVTKKPRAQKPESAGIAALQADTVEKVKALPLPVNKFDPAEFVDSLSVVQARALYDVLKNIFGG